jgi:hypothetical protein
MTHMTDNSTGIDIEGLSDAHWLSDGAAKGL